MNLLRVILLIILGWVIGLIISIKGISRDNNDNLIINRTNQKYLDTIIYSGLNMLEIKKARIIISDISSDFKPKNDTKEPIVGNTLGYITHISGNYYSIRIIKADKNESINILSHELVHLYQYHHKLLINNDDYYVWGYDTIYKPTSYTYFDRPWEVQARRAGDMLEYLLKNN